MRRGRILPMILMICASRIATSGMAAPEAQPTVEAAGTPRPTFSWDRVPQWLIVRKASAFNREETDLIAQSSLVVFEKETGFKDAGSVEEGILRAARVVKALNPTTVTLFYWNAVINYQHYKANQVFERNLDRWALKKEGKTLLFKNRYPVYNLLDGGWQDWWVSTAKEMASDPAIDGVMIDAICKTTPSDDGARSLYPRDDYGRAYLETATRLRSEVGSKLLVGNAIRANAPQCNLHHLGYLDGSYVERWAVPMGGAKFEDYVLDGMTAMAQALSAGKLILFNSGPDMFGGDRALSEDYEEKERWMKQNIQFPLAVFLVIAEEGAYFHWGSGPNTLAGANRDVWRNDIYPELSRPLGKPSGPAVREGYVFTRSFEHLDVWLDIRNREAKLDWK